MHSFLPFPVFKSRSYIPPYHPSNSWPLFIYYFLFLQIVIVCTHTYSYFRIIWNATQFAKFHVYTASALRKACNSAAYTCYRLSSRYNWSYVNGWLLAAMFSFILNSLVLILAFEEWLLNIISFIHSSIHSYIHSFSSLRLPYPLCNVLMWL